MKRRLVFLFTITLALFVPFSLQAGLLSDGVGGMIQQKLAELNLDDIAIDLNQRITIPDNPDAGIDGVDLFATVIRHTDSGPLPTIVITTPYRREFMLLLYLPLLVHDYNLLAVDIRGSGSSHGDWLSFAPEEHYDAAWVIDHFIPSQPWSNGDVGMIGPSYMAISQMLAAGQIETDETGAPMHLKALFPLVTMADVYRDIVMHGGNVDLEFIPMWLGLVDILGALPPLIGLGETAFQPSLDDINEATDIWTSHIANIPVTIGWIMNGDNINKNEFYETKSAMLYWPDKPEGGWQFSDEYPPDLGDTVIPDTLPVFMTGGWFDIFTRGTLNTWKYGLKNHDVTDKAMMIGSWYHLGGSMGLGVNGLMSCEIPARWFDWKIKGIEDPFMVDYPVLLYVLGEERWRAEKSWPIPEDRTETTRLYLSKKKASNILGDWFSVLNSSNNYRLTPDPQKTDYYNKFWFFRTFYSSKKDPVLRHDPPILHGLVSRSSSRWLMGLPALVSQASKFFLGKNIDPAMPWEDERLDEVGVLTFTTEPLVEDVEIAGPLKITFWAKTDFKSPLSEAAIEGMIDTIEDSFNIDNNMILGLMEKRDVQWVVELNDVFPDGRARNVSSGWLSAENRPFAPDNPRDFDENYVAFDPFYDHAYKNPSPIEENRLYKYVVEIWPTVNVFKKGHRIRVSLSASDFPHLFPVLIPSSNTIVIDEDHQANLEFTKVLNTEGAIWLDAKDPTNYILSHDN